MFLAYFTILCWRTRNT